MNSINRIIFLSLACLPLCFSQSTIDWHAECPIKSPLVHVGIDQSHQVQIWSGLSDLSTTGPLDLVRHAQYHDIAGRVFVIVLQATNKDAVLSWQMECAGHLIASAMRLENSTSAHFFTREILSVIRSAVKQFDQVGTQIENLMKEKQELDNAIHEEAGTARNIQETGHGWAAILGGKKTNLHLLRNLPHRLMRPNQSIANGTKSFVAALKTRLSALACLLPSVESFEQELEDALSQEKGTSGSDAPALYQIRARAIGRFVSRSGANAYSLALSPVDVALFSEMKDCRLSTHGCNNMGYLEE